MHPVQLPSPQIPLLTVSKAHEHVWVIELHNGEDNRLTEEMCVTALGPALVMVEAQWRDSWRISFNDKNDMEKRGGYGALIIVSNKAQNKFFSNGLDFQTIVTKPQFIHSKSDGSTKTNIGILLSCPTDSFNPIAGHLLSFPIPVIAAINGHAFAGGFILTMLCDYRVMKAKKAWLSMNELLFGAPIPRSVAVLFNAKCVDSMVVRKIFLEAHRFTAQEAFKVKLVDEIVDGDSSAVFGASVKLAHKVSYLSKLGVYGLIKREIYHLPIAELAEEHRIISPREEDEVFCRNVKPRL
ncbi:hypothetical protein FRC17_006638 [Serendipita sp. 399]|nr:hypothetical protein FRC17_006638 [Serendipita sp. 399]